MAKALADRLAEADQAVEPISLMAAELAAQVGVDAPEVRVGIDADCARRAGLGDDLRAWCANSGHELVGEYVDHVSGRKVTDITSDAGVD